MNPNLLVTTARDLPPSFYQSCVDGVLNLFYPEECVACSSPVASYRELGVCSRCWKRILGLAIAAPYCPCCGIPFQHGEEESPHLCGRCCLALPPYSGARAFGHYTGELRRVIQALKFHGRRNLSGLLLPLLESTFLSTWNRSEVDLIVPIPLHPKRKRERGFNQADLLARSLARFLGIADCEDALARIRPTLPQVGLSDRERLRNVRKAFACRMPEVVAGLKVLLVDDVMTTGATVSSASEALLESGARRISVLTVARVVSGMG